MATTKGGIIKTQVKAATVQHPVAQKSVAAIFNDLIDREGMQKRFHELLGKRTPQFLSAVVSLINSNSSLLQAFHDSPMTIIQAALKAATFDLPIDPNLGYAYIVPFRNKKEDGSYKMEATFIIGYKGMNQLALRSGVYKKINVVDIREGELKSYDRLTQEIKLEFVEDDDEREKLPIVGWCGYYQLMNGMEKTIYMTRKQIEQHEQRYRKGKYMGKGWRDDFDNMSMKTVYRRLIGKWGVMSIDYQSASPSLIATAEAIAKGEFDDEDTDRFNDIDNDAVTVPGNVDAETGEIKEDHTEDDRILEESIKDV
ncbi:recombinase RecT [Pectinatus frisingensis]|uniref:recombinase RecT n=1 Tax=Pectinatus frisingensis TaxID=865 RepID=UPI0018C50A8E|nr:recombinase RecT [Pectinatus frisingensis]